MEILTCAILLSLAQPLPPWPASTSRQIRGAKLPPRSFAEGPWGRAELPARNRSRRCFVPATAVERISIEVSGAVRVSGLLQKPLQPRACYILAHGAGAGMDHPFMVAVGRELAARGIATLRYQFPYMERGAKHPDPPQLAHATVRAAVATALNLAPKLPLIAGGKSFGGRMTSQAQAISPLEGVRGLAFLGFPLHPAGRPSHKRAEHLFDVQIPLLFVQGTRDPLASVSELRPLCEKLGRRATLKLFTDADHSFHVPARTGQNDAQVFSDVLDVLTAWVEGLTAWRENKLR